MNFCEITLLFNRDIKVAYYIASSMNKSENL